MRVHEDLLDLLSGHLPLIKRLHLQNSLAPVAASMDSEGEVTGYALTAKPSVVDVPVEYALDHFTRHFRLRLQNGTIRASAVFFHGHLMGDHVCPARTVDEANALVAWLDHASGQSVEAVIAYTMDGDPARHGRLTFTYDSPIFTETIPDRAAPHIDPA